MTDTEQCNQTFRTINPSSQKVISASPSLSREQIERLKSLAKMLHFKFEGKFSNRTTHLIVPSTDDKIAADDVVYYEALLSGVWIVTWNWIDDSSMAGDLIDEEEFQVEFVISIS